MKKYSKNLIALLLLMGGLSFFLTSCHLSDSGMKRSTGGTNELLIVTNDKMQWEGPVGDTIRSFFGQEQVGLSQPEPVFDMLNIGAANLNDLYKKFHDIFIVDINPAYTGASSETKENLWSEPQRVIKVSAPDLESFYKEFNAKKGTFMQMFAQLERKRSIILNKMASDISLSKDIINKFGIYIPLPGGFYVAQDAADFMWLRHKVTKERQDVEISILIYSQDYNDTIVFDPRHIIMWRNLVTREHVPGPSPFSYMTIAEEFIPPVFKTVTDFPGGYAVETRGLWDVENDYMGGPFLSFTFVNPRTNKVMTLDGYVYYPNNDKKNYLRELEAIFYAVEFP